MKAWFLEPLLLKVLVRGEGAGAPQVELPLLFLAPGPLLGYNLVAAH
ncbi:MAG: hypothetical protein AB1424_08785 [Thermodesulfobacteriota bacterium]